MDRPTSGNCAATLADGTVCGAPFEIKAQGNIPRYCLEHRDQALRTKLEREWRRNRLLEGAAPMEQEPDESAAGYDATGESAEGGPARVCRAGSCSIPLVGSWLNEFCPADWRLLPGDVKAELVGSRSDDGLHEVAIFHALRALGGRDVVQEFDYTSLS